MPAPSAPKRLWSRVAASSGDTRLFAAAYVILLPFYLAPLVVAAPLLPGLDLPFHLGMVDMLEKAGRPDSPYGPYYQGTLSLAPYAAHYLALLGLSKLVGIMTGHLLLVGLYVAGMPLAMGSLLDVLGRSRLPALLAFPLAYNLPLHYGFVSFAFSLPVLVLLLAQLARLLLAPSPGVIGSWGRWLLTAALAVLLFLCHLQNFLYGVCAGIAFMLFSAVPWRRRLGSLGAFLPALAALAYWQLTLRPDTWNRPRGAAYAWTALVRARKWDLPREPWPWAVDFKNRVVSVADNALRAFWDLSEVRACHALVFLIAFYFVLGIAGRLLLGRGPATERPRMRASTWVAFAGVLAAYVLLPHHLPAFDIVTFFPRFAPLVLLMALPLVPRGLLRFPLATRAVLAVPAVVFGAVWGVALTEHYRLYAAETADLRAVFAMMKPGHKVIGLPYERRSRVMRIESAHLGLVNFYVVVKPATGSMVPVGYCDMLHMPCIRKKPLDALPDPSPWTPDLLNMEKGVAFYDYFIVRAPPPRRDIFGKHKDRVELVMQRGEWWLWKRRGL